MKILCVARNYGLHAAEMKSAVPTQPVFFMKPDSAILHDGQPFFYPEFSHDIHHELELVMRIDKVGKSVSPQFAPRYYSSVTVGIDFTARDIQAGLKENRYPWLIAKGFDGSAVLGDFVPLADLGKDIQNLDIQLLKNGQEVQHGNTADMIFTVDQLISYISKFMLLRTGDLIYTGTPVGVGPVQVGDTLEGYLEGRKLMECRVK